MDIKIDANFNEFKKVLGGAPDKIIISSLVQSLNRGGRDGKSSAIKALTRATGIKRKHVKSRIAGISRRAKANKKKLNTILFIRTKKGIPYRKALTKSQIKKSSSIDRGSFVTTLQSGLTSRFKRTGDPKRAPKRGTYAGRIATRGAHEGRPLLREPIEELRFPLHPHGTKAARRAFEERARQAFPKEFKRLVNMKLSKYTKRG